MYYESGINNFFEGILRDRKSFSFIALLILTAIGSLLIYLTFANQFGLYVLVALVSVTLIYLIVNYPKFWLYTIAGFTFLFFRETSEGISVIDYATAILYSGSLIVWLIWMTTVNRKKIIHSFGDWFMLLFFVAHILNFFVALTYGNDMLGWTREALRAIIILYFIPIKYYFSDTKDLSKLLVVFGLSIVLSGLLQFYDYYRTLQMDAVYLYQMATSVRLNQAIFSASTIFGFVFLIYNKKIKNQIAVFLFTGVAFAGLFTSFSRAFWLIIAVNIFIIFIFATVKQKAKIGIYMTLIITILVIVIFNIFGNNFKYMVQIVEKRVLSSTEGKKDVSVQMRFAEYQAVYKKIEENPLSGNGLGSKIKFYHHAYKASLLTHNIHNGYLYTVQRYGIPMALLFFLSLFYSFFKSGYLIFKTDDPYERMLAIGTFNTLLMLFVTSFVTAIYFYRDGLFTVAFSLAIAGILERNHKERLLNRKAPPYAD